MTTKKPTTTKTTTRKATPKLERPKPVPAAKEPKQIGWHKGAPRYEGE